MGGEMIKVHYDERGSIENILDTDIKSVALIESEANVSRANHKHALYGHHCYLVSGKLIYYERPVGSKESPSKRTILPGELWYTPPQVEHKMLFLEKSTMWCFGEGSRTQENYESDTIRLDFDLGAV